MTKKPECHQYCYRIAWYITERFGAAFAKNALTPLLFGCEAVIFD
jgi:hypothetical protein